MTIAPSTVSAETLLETLRDKQAQAQALEAEIKDLKSAIEPLIDDGLFAHLTSEDGNSFVYKNISLSRSKRTSWKYPSAVTKQIKALQELAQLNGDAEMTVTHFWTLRAL